MWAPEQALQRVLVRGPERAPKTWMERGLQLQCSVPVMSRVLQAVPTLLPVPVLAPAQALDLMRALEPVQVPKTLMGTVAVATWKLQWVLLMRAGPRCSCHRKQQKRRCLAPVPPRARNSSPPQELRQVLVLLAQPRLRCRTQQRHHLRLLAQVPQAQLQMAL